MSFNIPVLFLVFNRPDNTRRVFNQIKQIQPSYLFIAADGPRADKNEDHLCHDVRNIVTDINWDAEVKTLFRDSNLGCGPAVSQAITWFFKEVEYGIILEDDCLPSLSFFYFTAKMLEKYKEDHRIWHVAGYNIQHSQKRGEGDYYFSRETPIWGWATWRRVWEHYTFDFNGFDKFQSPEVLNAIKKSRIMSITTLYDMKKVKNGSVNTWDFQYAYAQLINHGLSIIPNMNLVENIGFMGDTTHFFSPAFIRKFKKNNALTFDTNQISHPLFVLPDVEADDYLFKIYINIFNCS
jgi:hypothetical protein